MISCALLAHFALTNVLLLLHFLVVLFVTYLRMYLADLTSASHSADLASLDASRWSEGPGYMNTEYTHSVCVYSVYTQCILSVYSVYT